MTCPFCTPDPARIVFETDLVIAMREGYPVSRGHLAISPIHAAASAG